MKEWASLKGKCFPSFPVSDSGKSGGLRSCSVAFGIPNHPRISLSLSCFFFPFKGFAHVSQLPPWRALHPLPPRRPRHSVLGRLVRRPRHQQQHHPRAGSGRLNRSTDLFLKAPFPAVCSCKLPSLPTSCLNLHSDVALVYPSANKSRACLSLMGWPVCQSIRKHLSPPPEAQGCVWPLVGSPWCQSRQLHLTDQAAALIG